MRRYRIYVLALAYGSWGGITVWAFVRVAKELPVVAVSIATAAACLLPYMAMT